MPRIASGERSEIVAAINHKLLFPAELTELGLVISGQAQGRFSDQQITFFKSVGNAVQDAFAAQKTLATAAKLGLGYEVEL